MISSFSYGHQRLIEIARGARRNPTLLCSTNPRRIEFEREARTGMSCSTHRTPGLTILIIDHDMTLVSEAAQHITVLNFETAASRTANPWRVLRHPMSSPNLGTE